MKLRSLAATFAVPFAIAAVHPGEADAQTKGQKPAAGSKLYKAQKLPPLTFEQACPQIKNIETILVPSDYYSASLSFRELKALGEIPENDANLLESIDELLRNATRETRDKDTYRITIGSPGGSFLASMALGQAIVNYGAERFVASVPTVAASGATIILAAIKGKKYGMPTTEIMTHGTSLDLGKNPTKAAIENEKTRKKNSGALLAEFYRANLDISYQCAEYLIKNGDLFISAEQALALKFLDALIKPRGMIEIRKEDKERFEIKVPTVSSDKEETTGSLTSQNLYAELSP